MNKKTNLLTEKQELNQIEQQDLGLVTLSKPIICGEQSFNTFKLREIKAGDLRGVKISDFLEFDVDALAVVIPRISTPTLTAKDIYQLNLKDFNALGAGVASFFIEK